MTHAYVGEFLDIHYGYEGNSWVESRTLVYECDACKCLVVDWNAHQDTKTHKMNESGDHADGNGADESVSDDGRRRDDPATVNPW